MKYKYFECDCGDVEHVIRFSYFDDEPEIYVNTYLKKSNFFKRLWYGIKYIFGFQSKYGAFGETLLHTKQIMELRNFCANHLANR